MKIKKMRTTYLLSAAGITLLTSSLSFGLILSSGIIASAKETDSTFRRFQDWCVNTNNLPEKTKNLVDQILKSVDNKDCKVAERKLMSLEEINLRGEFCDLRPISTLKNVKRLNVIIINSSMGGTDVKPLSQMTQLTHLVIGGGVTDIRPIAKLINLTYLDLGGNQIQDLQPISHLTNLTHLELLSNHLSGDLEELSNLTQLRYLGVMSYSRNNLNLSFLRNMTQLESLIIPKSGIQDITPLAKLKKLKQLFLPNNPISDIQPLTDLTNLAEIDLRNTQVQDFSLLSKLPKLKYLQTGKIKGQR
jgi:internalin A